jgi:cytochrome c oxidase subunit 2
VQESRESLRPVGACLLAALLSPGLTGCSAQLDGLAPVTTQGRAVAQLFWLVLAISAVVFLLVAGLLLYIVARYRARPGEEPSRTEGNRRLEIGWTTGALLLLAILFIPTLRTMAAVDAPAANALRIQVIAHQWWWEYRYPESGVVTANELHVPVGRPLQFDLESADVVHSFWVPQFGWKRDVVPGKINSLPVQVEQAGVYDGACTEYCGLEHAWMRIRVVADAPDRFDAWIAAQQQPAAAPQGATASRGQQILVASTCVNCHTVRGTAAAGQIGPDLTHVGSRTILGAGVLGNSPENLARFVHDAPSIKPGLLMPSFLSMSDADVAALAAYLAGLQ